MVETTNQSGGILSRFAQGQNIDEPFAESNSGTTSYYEADGLGSVTSLTAANGSVAQTYTYDSFGNTTHSTGSLANPFQYTAREFDFETGLYYYRARYYDPSVGRFLSEDPMGFGAGVNFYRYVGNNPPLWRDPDGRGPDWGGLYNSFSNAANKTAWINCFIKLGFCNPKQIRKTNDQMTWEQELNTAIALQQSGHTANSESQLNLTQGCAQDKNCAEAIEECVKQVPVAGPASPPSWWSWVLGKLK